MTAILLIKPQSVKSENQRLNVQHGGVKCKRARNKLCFRLTNMQLMPLFISLVLLCTSAFQIVVHTDHKQPSINYVPHYAGHSRPLHGQQIIIGHMTTIEYCQNVLYIKCAREIL